MYTPVYFQCPACLGYKSRAWRLCKQCFTAYGYAQSLWPDWLSFLVNDNDRIYQRDRVDDAALVRGYGDLDSFEAYA